MTSRIERNKRQRNKIVKDVVEEKTKTISIKVFKILFKVALVFLIIYLILRYLGTSGLVVREYMIEYDNIPDGVTIKDANDIIPIEKFFIRENSPIEGRNKILFYLCAVKMLKLMSQQLKTFLSYH